jgi:hypothetical protein
MRVLSLVLILAATPALAQQPASDPIGALLEQPAQPTPELEEPDTAAEQGPGPEIEPDPTVALPPTPQPYVPPPAPPRLERPVHITETGKSPDAPPTVNDLAYESRIRSSMASAQGFQGPLDGGWTLASSEGDLYAFQLVDRGSGAVEGAWRDVRRPGALEGSGFLDQVERVGGEVTLRFDSGARVATLQASADGRWTGELMDGAARKPVTLRRRN